MARIELRVPFAEKDQAKQLGARWDAVKRLWYVPDGIDPVPLQKWIPQDYNTDLIAPTYYIAHATQLCWKCGKPTQVFGFMLPPGHKIVDEIGVDDDNEVLNGMVTTDSPAFVSYVQSISKLMEKRILSISKNYRKNYSKTTESQYWMNHCENCGMKQGDYHIYNEPEGPFFIMDKNDASGINLYFVAEKFEADYEAYHNDVDYFNYMHKYTMSLD